MKREKRTHIRQEEYRHARELLREILDCPCWFIDYIYNHCRSMSFVVQLWRMMNIHVVMFEDRVTMRKPWLWQMR
jgi:hypothetical protein